MKSELTRILGAIVVAALLASAGYWVGLIRGHNMAVVEEYQESIYVLSQISSEGEVGEEKRLLMEYLKAKLYYFSHSVPRGLILETPDFGRVEERVLGDIRPYSDMVDYAGDYENFLKTKVE